jgi:hypothetical protein
MSVSHTLSFGEYYYGETDMDDEYATYGNKWSYDVVFYAKNIEEGNTIIRDIVNHFFHNSKLLNIPVSYNSCICSSGNMDISSINHVADSLITDGYWCCKNQTGKYRAPVSCFAIDHKTFRVWSGKDDESKIIRWNSRKTIEWNSK